MLPMVVKPVGAPLSLRMLLMVVKPVSAPLLYS